jgi:predicted ArsR family transcriptional regulator
LTYLTNHISPLGLLLKEAAVLGPIKPDRILETTRGRVVALLRGGDMTVEELAQALGLTDNAVRAHLATLERDGLVHAGGERREGRVGKPATFYRLSPDVELLFSQAYLPLLTALLAVLGDRLEASDLRSFLQQVGSRLAAGVQPPTGELFNRVDSASKLLNQLGGLSSVQEVTPGRGYIIQSRGCPVGAAVRERAEVCEALVSLIAELTGVQVRSCCQRGDQPSCCFEIGESSAGGAPL